MSKDKPMKEGPEKKNELDKYTEIDEEMFDETYSRLGNDDCILKIVDGITFKDPKYYILTKFLIDGSK